MPHRKIVKMLFIQTKPNDIYTDYKTPIVLWTNLKVQLVLYPYFCSAHEKNNFTYSGWMGQRKAL